MKKSYDYIFFDYDGCLAQTLDVILDVYRELFIAFGLPKTDQELISIWGDWRGPLRLGISEADLPLWIEKYKAAVNARAPQAPLYPHVREMLTELKAQGKQLALLSSSESSSIKPVLEQNKLQEFFTVFLFANDVTKHKPDPEIIYKALALIGGDADKAVMIGDSKSDLGAAKNAGIDSILYYPEHNQQFYAKESLLQFEPTHVVDDFRKVALICE